MEININKIEHGPVSENDQTKVLDNKQIKDLCSVFKTKRCNPKIIQFEACLTCSRCTALLPETAIRSVFNGIINIAVMLMNVFNPSSGGAGSGNGGGNGAGGSGGAGGGGK